MRLVGGASTVCRLRASCPDSTRRVVWGIRRAATKRAVLEIDGHTSRSSANCAPQFGRTDPDHPNSDRHAPDIPANSHHSLPLDSSSAGRWFDSNRAHAKLEFISSALVGLTAVSRRPDINFGGNILRRLMEDRHPDGAGRTDEEMARP